MNLYNNEEILSNVVTAKEGLPVKAIVFDLPDMNAERLPGGTFDVRREDKTPVKVLFGNDGISIHPEGMGTADGDYPPILIERDCGKIRLLYWPDINQQEPVIVDLSTALESARKCPKNDYEGGACPDCGEPIPDDAEYGESCANCEHVWNP